MNKRMVKRRPRKQPKPWSLARLFRECRAAPVTYLALCQLADESGSPTVTPTREQISKLTGIGRLRTVSTTLSALSKAKWLKIEHVPITENRRVVGMVLRITLFHRRVENRPIGEDARRIAPNDYRRVKNRPTAEGQKLTHDSPTERGGHCRPALSPNGGAGHKPTSAPPVKTNISEADKCGPYDPHADSEGPLRSIVDILGIRND